MLTCSVSLDRIATRHQRLRETPAPTRREVAHTPACYQEWRNMEAVIVLIGIGLAMALLLLGICVNACEREQETKTEDKGDAYRLRADSTRRPDAYSPPR
jgi:hypothetical protein